MKWPGPSYSIKTCSSILVILQRELIKVVPRQRIDVETLSDDLEIVLLVRRCTNVPAQQNPATSAST